MPRIRCGATLRKGQPHPWHLYIAPNSPKRYNSPVRRLTFPSRPKSRIGESMSMEAVAASSSLSPFEQLRFARQVILTESRALAQVANRLDGEFCRAVDLAFRCQGSVIVCGMGKARLGGPKNHGHVGFDGHAEPQFASRRSDSRRFGPGATSRRDADAFAKRVKPRKSRGCFPSLVELGVPIVAITASSASTLGPRCHGYH